MRSARLITIVFARGISRPFSIIVVETSTSASSRINCSITFSSSVSRICPCPTTTRAFGTSRLTMAASEIMDSTRLCTKNTCPSRASSSSIDALHQRLRKRRDGRLNRQAVFRRRFDHAHIAQTDQRHVQRARNRRRGHGQHVHILAHFLQPFLVRHTEALLLIHHQQAEVLKFHVLGKQCGACR